MAKMAPISNKEKIMLIFVGLALVLALMYLFVAKPMLDSMFEKRAKIDELKTTNEEMMATVNELPRIKETLEKVDGKIDEARKNFHPSMEAWKVEKVVTNVVVGNGVSVTSSVITPEVTAMVTADEEGNTTSTTTTPDGKTPPNAIMSKIPGIYMRTVSITFSGSVENVKKTLNQFATSDKKLVVTDFTYSIEENDICEGSFNVVVFMIKD